MKKTFVIKSVRPSSIIVKELYKGTMSFIKVNTYSNGKIVRTLLDKYTKLPLDIID